MYVFAVIEAMCEGAGLSCERVSSLAGFDAWLIEEAIQQGRDLRLDAFLRIADVCGYRLEVRSSTKRFAAKSNAERCVKDTDVTPSFALSRLFELTEAMPREVSRRLGRAPGYVPQMISNRTVPRMSTFLSIVEAVGCEAVIRRFRESYVLDKPVDVGREAVARRTRESRVLGKPIDPTDSHVDQRISEPETSAVSLGSDKSVGLLIHEAFKSYTNHLLDRKGREKS